MRFGPFLLCFLRKQLKGEARVQCGACLQIFLALFILFSCYLLIDTGYFVSLSKPEIGVMFKMLDFSYHMKNENLITCLCHGVNPFVCLYVLLALSL